jgi:hypothetical protein
MFLYQAYHSNLRMVSQVVTYPRSSSDNKTRVLYRDIPAWQEQKYIICIHQGRVYSDAAPSLMEA